MRMAIRTVPARAALGVLFAVSAMVATVAPSAAAQTTPYFAAFPREVTTPTACNPPSQTHFCYTGQDHSGLGTSVPPGGPATEDFTGFVDFASPGVCPDGSTGFHDTNTVTITTRAGKLLLTTNGLACGLGQPISTDQGTWTATGGTGIFTGATGSGNVATVGTAPNPTTGQISSASLYTGNLTLQGGSGGGGD